MYYVRGMFKAHPFSIRDVFTILSEIICNKWCFPWIWSFKMNMFNFPTKVLKEMSLTSSKPLSQPELALKLFSTKLDKGSIDLGFLSLACFYHFTTHNIHLQHNFLVTAFFSTFVASFTHTIQNLLFIF